MIDRKFNEDDEQRTAFSFCITPNCAQNNQRKLIMRYLSMHTVSSIGTLHYFQRIKETEDEVEGVPL